MTDPIIDAHMHLFTKQSDDFPRGVHELYDEERTAHVEDYLPIADQCGVEHSVLVSLDDHDEYIAYVLNRYPGRFSAVAVMDVEADDPRDDLLRRLEMLPLVGFRVWTLGANESLEIPQSYLQLLEVMQERGIAAWFYSDELQQRALASVVERFPDLTIMLNHLGFCQSGFECDEWGRPRISTTIPPDSFSTVQQLAQHENVAVMFSGQYAFSKGDYPYPDLQETGQMLLEAFGPERLVWASDWPWISEVPGYRALLDLVPEQLPGISPSELSQIMGGNAQRLLGIEVQG